MGLLGIKSQIHHSISAETAAGERVTKAELLHTGEQTHSPVHTPGLISKGNSTVRTRATSHLLTEGQTGWYVLRSAQAMIGSLLLSIL